MHSPTVAQVKEEFPLPEKWKTTSAEFKTALAGLARLLITGQDVHMQITHKGKSDKAAAMKAAEFEPMITELSKFVNDMKMKNIELDAFRASNKDEPIAFMNVLEAQT